MLQGLSIARANYTSGKIVIFCLCVFLAGCGNDKQTENHPFDLQLTNELSSFPIRGKLYYEVSDEYFELDLVSRIRTKLFEFPLVQGAELVEPQNSNEFVRTQRKYEEWVIYTYIQTVDRNGAILSEFRYSGDDSSRPRVSKDGSTIALYLDPNMQAYDDKGLMLFSREGEIIWHYRQNSNVDQNGHFYNRIKAYEWMPNGNILISEGDTIFRLVPGLNGTEKVVVKRFPGYELFNSLRLSPDGEKLVFNMAPYPLSAGFGDIQLWTINLDGTGLRQLTNSDEDVDGATWSPDGDHLIIRKATKLRPCSNMLFVLSYEAESEELTVEPTDNAAPLMFYDDGTVEYVCRSNDFPEWL